MNGFSAATSLIRRAFGWGRRQLLYARDARHWHRQLKNEVKHPVMCDVIIACGDKDRIFLAESIRSVRNQSFAFCVIHVCFDGTPSREIMQEFPEVRFYRTLKQSGPFRIANELTRFCQTDYIAIQDADDVALPTRIWEAVTSLQESGRTFYGGQMVQFCDARHTNAALIERLRANPWHKSGARWPTCPYGSLINGTLVFSRKRFEELNGYGDLFCSGDDDLSNRLHFSKEKRVLSTRVVAMRRLHDSGMTASTHAQGTENRRVADRLVLERLGDLESGKATPESLGALKQHLSAPQVEELLSAP